MKKVLYTIWVLYTALLIYMIFSDLPHGAGWFAATIWFIMYIVNDGISNKMIQSYRKLNDEIFIDWADTLLQYMNRIHEKNETINALVVENAKLNEVIKGMQKPTPTRKRK